MTDGADGAGVPPPMREPLNSLLICARVFNPSSARVVWRVRTAIISVAWAELSTLASAARSTSSRCAPVRHRRHRQVDGLHAVVVDGVDVRAALHETWTHSTWPLAQASWSGVLPFFRRGSTLAARG